jgi:hypothetical protein
MPYYKQVVEDIGSAGGSQIRVRYDVDKGNTVTGTFPRGTAAVPLPSVSGMLRGIPLTSFRQQEKLPVDFSMDPCDITKFDISGYSTPRNRIVYIGEELGVSLNNNYTGCCFDENGNQVPEPSLGQKRTMDITLEGIGFDAYGKPTWASQPNNFYFVSCGVTEPVGTVVRSETFTVTFNSMSPQISGVAPYLDDDVQIILERSDGQSVTATSSSTAPISMTATYPQTIQIKIRGEFSKKLFPNEIWEYYFEKYDPETNQPKTYTPVPGHLPIQIPIQSERTFDQIQTSVAPAIIDNNGDVTQPQGAITLQQYTQNISTSTLDKVYPVDPNTFVDAYRIDQNNKNGTGIVRDLSVEVPISAGAVLLRYVQDQEDDVDVIFNFSVTSTIPSLNAVAWAIGLSLTAGSYVTNGGNTYLVEVGGIVSPGLPPSTPADVGPSGTAFFVDNSGITYRYVPTNIANLTSYGAGSWSTTVYVMNDQKIGAEKFEELLNQQQNRRTK